MLELELHRELGNFTINMNTLCTGNGITALFGRSGAGKTSIIQMVAGLETPDYGRIILSDKILFDSNLGINLPPEQRRLGYVFQQALLFPHLSVHQNLTFGMKRIPVNQRVVSFDDVVSILGIESLLTRRPAKLSGGEKQRVAVGRALLASPHLLLMDEPLSGLDSQRKAELLPFIVTVSQRFSIPILYVSHAMDEVLALADHLVLLESGQAIATGLVEDILSRPELRPFFPPHETGTVINTKINRHDSLHGLTYLEFFGEELIISGVDIPIKTTVRIRVSPNDITLSLIHPLGISTRNILQGKILSIEETPDHRINVIINCQGVTLWSQITSLAQQDLNLKTGMDIFILIKAITLTRNNITEYQPMEN